MVFSSPLFLFLFLPAVLAATFAVRRLENKNAVLLLASLVFYAWGEVLFLFLLLASTGINYALGKRVGPETPAAVRKRSLVLALILNLGLLAFFKYANFVTANLNTALEMLSLGSITESKIPLPIGISFFTFHALSYIFDIYYGKARAAEKVSDVALYIFFFPQLVAGPILRWNAIAPQLAARSVTLDDFGEGVRRFITGLAKKMIIANAVAVPADQIFGLPASELTPAVAWWGLLCYSLQIYFDFSGYSDMAVGLGKMFGFKFLENFNFPYIARSIQDFWRRWHISLSSWFRDYLYIPLGGNRLGENRTYLNLLTVFLLCGLWHGASWTFVLWGLYHGLFLILERTRFGDWLIRLPAPVQHVYTILAFMFGWVLFRADTLPHALGYYAALLGAEPTALPQPLGRYTGREAVTAAMLGITFSAPLVAWFYAACQRWSAAWTVKVRTPLNAVAVSLEALLYLALLLVCSAWLAGGTYNPFIYFRF